MLFSAGTACYCAVSGVSVCCAFLPVSWFEDSCRYADPFSFYVDSTAICVVEVSPIKSVRWGRAGFQRGAC